MREIQWTHWYPTSFYIFIEPVSQKLANVSYESYSKYKSRKNNTMRKTQ